MDDRKLIKMGFIIKFSQYYKHFGGKNQGKDGK